MQYRMNDSGDLEFILQETYSYTNAEEDQWVTLKVNLPLYTAPGGEETFLLAPQKVRFMKIDNSWDWVLVEAEDGQYGWMHVQARIVMDLGLSTDEVFDRLSQAG